MLSAQHRVLVVDDEIAILKLICRELLAEGIECDVAMDGEEALQLVNGSQYDAVVTDIKMPNMHGHALAHEILHRKDRPLIVVYTGVLEPRLAKDLLMLGVDDIVFKPVDFAFLAMKLKSMLQRRQRPKNEFDLTSGLPQDTAKESESVEDSTSAPISFSRLNLKVAEISRILPISNTALDVYEMTRGGEWNLQQLAAAIQRDASLTAEVLRLANCSLFNRSGRRIIELDEAVLRLGQKHIGELALTATALSALAPGMLPWMDLQLAWKRSMASGILLESLIECGGHQEIEEGLLLCAILHPLGRVVLGMLFPKHYEAMVKNCEQTGETLRQQERHMFPTSHAEIMSQLFATWRIPSDLVLPLKFALDDFSATAGISEPMRTKAELVHVAIALGRLAVGRWETWDLVQFPAPCVLRRLGIGNAVDLVRQTRLDVDKLAGFRPGGRSSDEENASPATNRSIAYCNVSDDSDDFLAELLPAIGLKPKAFTLDELRNREDPWIANCISAAPAQIAADCSKKNALAVTNHECREMLAGFARTVALPNSYGRLRDDLLEHLLGQGAVRGERCQSPHDRKQRTQLQTV